MRSEAVLFAAYLLVILGGLAWFGLAGLGRL
jgi:hypothetical protein